MKTKQTRAAFWAKTRKQIRADIAATTPRSAWSRGVQAYALELLENLTDEDLPLALPPALLNGARDWRQYSEGGCALIYDADIAERLCSPSELKRTRGGERQPNSSESWLDCQARALNQAARLIAKHGKGDA